MLKRLNNQEFEELVKDGIDLVPEKILKKMENVEICLEDKLYKNKDNSLVLGLYQGVPKTVRTNYGQVLPDKITIFKGSIEKIARNKEEVKRIVAETIHHEIAHHFGFSEEGIKKLNK